MRDALITLPPGLSREKEISVYQFKDALERRDFICTIDAGPELKVWLDGEELDYETLAMQSRNWSRLTSAKFKLLTETAQLPTRGSLDCAGLDLYADIPEPVVLHAGKVTVIPTGLAVQCPVGTYAQIKERSSLGAKGIAVRGGVVDRDYRGEIKVMLQLISNDLNANFYLNPGDRIAQLVFVAYIDAVAEKADALFPTVRDGGGFGSTGR